jgi:hypothetical protein
MSRRPARCTQADMARAIRAIKQESADMVVEIAPDGTIRIVPIEKREQGKYRPAERKGEPVL